MTDIHIRANTTTDEIRSELSAFGWFSKVEARVVQETTGKVIVLHEVKLGERLRRFVFQSKEQRDEFTQKSRNALNHLIDSRPRLAELIGRSIQYQDVWTANELRKVLASPISQLVPDETQTGLIVPGAANYQVGIANAKITDIVADEKVIWDLKPVKGTFSITQRIVNEPNTYVESVVAIPSTPSDQQIRSAYRDALIAAKGHVVLAPIQDIEVSGSIITETQKGIHQGDIQCCSDNSLSLLLETITEARLNNEHLTAVTIATKEYVEKGLAGRIEDLQAARRLEAEKRNLKSERGRFYPQLGFQAPRSAGVHFLTNSPFELQAGKTIVPRSLVQSNQYEYVEEGDASALPKRDNGRLIGFDDDRMDLVTGGSPKDFGDRFSQLLSNMTGTVVIYPPPAGSKEQLEAMMWAVIEACTKAPALSVSFATEDKSQRDALTNAYVAAKLARQDAQELDMDADPDEEIIVLADLWKKA